MPLGRNIPGEQIIAALDTMHHGAVIRVDKTVRHGEGLVVMYSTWRADAEGMTARVAYLERHNGEVKLRWCSVCS